MTPRTLYDKLWDDHVVQEDDDGTALIYVDRHLVHEVTSPQAYEGLKLAKFFKAIYGGNSFVTKKPDPLGANTLLHELAVAPQNSLMIGDSEVDVQTARNAGMISAIVNFGFGTHDRDTFPADIYLDRMEELLPLVANGSR